jgi:hypothetical protein
MNGRGGIEGIGIFGYVPVFGGTPYGVKFERSRTMSDPISPCQPKGGKREDHQG